MTDDLDALANGVPSQEDRISAPAAETAPRVYYEDEAVTLYLGDCLEVMPTLEPVDHVITDPPYEAEALASSAVPPTQVAASDSQQGEGAVCDTLVPLPGAAATQPSAVPASSWRPAQATKALIDEADDWLQALFDFEVGGNTPTRLERAAVDIIKGLLILVEPDDPPVPLSDQTQDETKRSDAL